MAILVRCQLKGSFGPAGVASDGVNVGNPISKWFEMEVYSWEKLGKQKHLKSKVYCIVLFLGNLKSEYWIWIEVFLNRFLGDSDSQVVFFQRLRLWTSAVGSGLKMKSHWWGTGEKPTGAESASNLALMFCWNNNFGCIRRVLNDIYI